MSLEVGNGLRLQPSSNQNIIEGRDLSLPELAVRVLTCADIITISKFGVSVI